MIFGETGITLILWCLERKVNANSVTNTDNYAWFISSDVKDEDRDKANKLMNSNQKVPDDLKHKIREHRGVAIAVKKCNVRLVESIEPAGSRILTVRFRCQNMLNIIAAYAPTSAAKKEENYTFLLGTWNHGETNPKARTLVHCGGDFNTKRILLNEEVEEQLGEFYLKANESTFENALGTTLANRELFLKFANNNDLFICNTHYKKSNEKLCTHLPIGGVRTEQNWDYFNFDLIDYILARIDGKRE